MIKIFESFVAPGVVDLCCCRRWDEGSTCYLAPGGTRRPRHTSGVMVFGEVPICLLFAVVICRGYCLEGVLWWVF